MQGKTAEAQKLMQAMRKKKQLFVRSSMFDIRVCDDGARIIRDALRLYKKQWPGGHPQEQQDIEFLETQFTKMVLESTIDA